MEEETKYYYRYDNTKDMNNRPIILLTEFKVIKRNPKSVFIQIPAYLYGQPWTQKIIYDHSNTKFAWPTLEEAKTSYIRRKEKQIAILERQLANAKNALEVTNLEGAFELGFKLYRGEILKGNPFTVQLWE